MTKAPNINQLPLGTKQYQVNDAAKVKLFKNFEDAADFAKAITTRDVDASPRICELELQEEIIDRQRFREWMTVREWLLDDGELVNPYGIVQNS